ncbi:MAG: NUDIX domain-containing protein [Candidatus Limnocylindrales bacterium]
MTPEQVLVVDRAVIPDGAAWRGLRTEGVDAFLATVTVHGRFEDRSAAEQDPTRKQVIPYLVLRDGERYFLMRRSRAGADARLHDRYSIGVGGHLNPGDEGPLGGLEREWREELDADFLPTFRAIGLLNDESTEVGSVHIGIVYSADAVGRPVTVRERHKLSGAFASRAEVAAVVDGMESWSRLVFEALERPEVP